MQAAQPAPRLLARRLGRALQDRAELLGGELGLALLDELGGQHVADVDEVLDIERGVFQPGLGKGARRPVGRRVRLRERDAECVLDDRAEADALVPEQARGQLGVEDRGGLEAEFAQRRQILARRVQHPLLVADRGLQRAEVADRRRVEEEDAAPRRNTWTR